MSWAGIAGNQFFGPFKVDDGVMMNSKNNISFLDSRGLNHIYLWMWTALR